MTRSQPVLTSVGWVFDLCNIPSGSHYLKKKGQNRRTVSFTYLKKIKIRSESKNRWVQVVEKTDRKNCRFWVFQKLQRTARFRENPSQDPTILGAYI
jgi:hypothetical protein